MTRCLFAIPPARALYPMRGDFSKARRLLLCCAFFVCAELPARTDTRAVTQTLRAGTASLQIFPLPSGRFGIRLSTDGTEYRQDAPLAVEFADTNGAAAWTTGDYEKAMRVGDSVSCSGTVTSARGTSASFADVYRVLPGQSAFEMSRTVKIIEVGAGDAGFSSRFLLPAARPLTTRDCDFFVPGVWYKDNAHVPPTALASHLDDRFLYFREDRLPYPVAMLRENRGGVTLTLAHVGGIPTTFAGEDGLTRIIDARMQFGALGFENAGHLAAAFVFPGTEGERTYTYGGSTEGNHWAFRSHPVKLGFSHAYRLVLTLEKTPDFPAALRRVWRLAWKLAAPPVIPADLPKVYRDGMTLLATYCHDYHGVICIPFFARLSDGEPTDLSSQMGFVGQALPAAFLLLRWGLETSNEEAVKNASKVVDFWAKNAPTPSGLPKSWYNIRPDGTFFWRNDPIFLRVASDGMDGALQAWNAAKQHGREKPEWLTFCRAYGDWLTRAQNADGSWSRTFDFDGKPQDKRKETSDQPIRFLVDLFKATGDARYRNAARRAGEFCWTTVHQAYIYVGGAADNPNVMDKEGGMMALDAFLALYDVTGEKKWLTAATQAAWYCETWVYLWNIPMPKEADPKRVFPSNRTTYGLSLIATGHSGADDYMAAAPFLFYRLSLLTGETHFREVAHMLMHDTKQLTNWDDTLGYKYPGLLPEALSLPPLRGHGVNGWLPWLSVVILEPMMRLRETFGAFDIVAIEKTPKTERLKADARFSKTRGFALTPSPARKASPKKHQIPLRRTWRK